MKFSQTTKDILRTEITFHYARSSGPGGQNVNKVNSKAILEWDIYATNALSEPVKDRFVATFSTRINKQGVFQISCDEHRDQSRNREICFQRLIEMIAAVIRPPKTRRPTKPTKASRIKRAERKNQRSELKKSRAKVRIDS